MNELQGVIVPLITPLNADGSLNETNMQDLLEKMIAAGVQGVFVAGTTGEVLALSTQVRAAAIQCVCAAARGRIQVVTGIGDSCMENILHFAEISREGGADYLALQPPPYFPMAEAEVGEFYEYILDSVTTPVLLYNIPSFTKNDLTANLVHALSEHPRVAGLKDSTGDAKYFDDVMAQPHKPGFTVLLGDEVRMYDGYRGGAKGIVPSIGNLYPELCVKLDAAGRAGNWAETTLLQAEVNKIIAPLRAGSWMRMIAWLKSQLEQEGICQSHMAGLFAKPMREPSQV